MEAQSAIRIWWHDTFNWRKRWDQKIWPLVLAISASSKLPATKFMPRLFSPLWTKKHSAPNIQFRQNKFIPWRFQNHCINGAFSLIDSCNTVSYPTIWHRPLPLPDECYQSPHPYVPSTIPPNWTDEVEVSSFVIVDTLDSFEILWLHETALVVSFYQSRRQGDLPQETTNPNQPTIRPSKGEITRQ